MPRSFFDGGEEATLPVNVSFSPARLGLGLFRTLSGEGASYRISGSLECQTPYGPLDLPYDKSGTAPFRRP